MDDIERQVVDLIERFLARHRRTGAAVALATSLYQDGLGMDSLDAAEFSTLLERAFGSDPYSSGDFPRTVGDVVGFYRRTGAGAS